MAGFRIEKRKLSSGELRYKCIVREKSQGKIIHNESKTFSTKALADTWGKKRVHELETERVTEKKRTVTLGTLLNMYFEDHDLWNRTGRTKQYVIKMLMDCDIAKIQSNALKVSDVIEHCRNRRDAGASPSTIYHDVAYLRSVMKVAYPVWNIDANYKIFEDAVPVLIDMGLVGKSQKRTRRPTSDELERLREGLQKRMEYRPNGTKRIPYLDILDFSLLTCMRIGEVCKITWDDLNTQHKTVMVRDRKDPRKKAGNHMIVPLLGGSFDIAQRQPKIDERIFPHNPRSVTAGFQRVRNELGIEDLRYHDLRREGASRLFEKGYTIEEVAQVTGHRNLNILWQVYTQLFPHKLHSKSL
ncbi:integrase [Pseudoalteromonas sp. GCY]|uniref:site-specific integrase n=1 Tax=Pseudoalteromonas sp. GCY TaxID=2003316 RepID=UPI000BFED767|nr:site-specific integrase [Pseudoalteromonas sp. GCY]PHI36338.1 integrase [Pseudoalteromonas sp. GCY]QQQ66899.1 site-specific integrase [Pseudoalteromonas sp. GCY]